LGLFGDPYFDERNNRVKFFSTDIHTERRTIDSLLAQCVGLMRQENATRVNARFLSSGNYESEDIEATIPLNNGFSGIEILFVGINDPERMSSAEVLEEEERILAEACPPERHIRKIPDEYKIEHLKTLQDGDIDTLVELYSEAFTTYTSPLDHESIREMVENSEVYVARYKPTGRIVSVSVAEIAELKTPVGNIRVCELSEMATFREHRGKGLVTATTYALTRAIRNRVDMMFAEARACHMPVNRAFHNMEFRYAGRLNKQCILSGDHEVIEEGPYENLNVWYMLPD